MSMAQTNATLGFIGGKERRTWCAAAQTGLLSRFSSRNLVHDSNCMPSALSRTNQLAFDGANETAGLPSFLLQCSVSFQTFDFPHHDLLQEAESQSIRDALRSNQLERANRTTVRCVR